MSAVRTDARPHRNPADAPRKGWPRTPWPWVARVVRERPQALSITLLCVSLVTWWLSLIGSDPREMNDLGLVSIIRPTGFVAIVLLIGGFVSTVLHPGLSSGYWKAYVVGWITIVHGTPAALYGTLRYAWAWKHVGIVDYIQRSGAVDPSISVLDVYHNWPGFFSLNASLNGSGDPLTLAAVGAWAPLFFNLLFFLALVSLFRRLTHDDTHVALSIWFFFLASWVGQDYFSPQALSFFLYLTMVGLALGAFAVRPPLAHPRYRVVRSTRLRARANASIERWKARLSARLSENPKKYDEDSALRWPRLEQSERFAVTISGLVITLAIVVTHQLTPVALTFMLAGLVALGYIRPRMLPALSAGALGAWLITGASRYMFDNTDELQRVGAVRENVAGTLTNLDVLSAGQVFVSMSSRLLVVLVAALAGFGAWRMLQRRAPLAVALVLAGAPLAFVAVSSYGNEILFRIFLFALPGASFLIAGGLLHRPERTTAVVIAAASLALAGLFLPAYWGKEKANYFTKEEIQVVKALMDSAPENSLLVELSRNYPSQFVEYEKFTYVPISREPWETRERITAAPARELAKWLSNPEYEAGYVLMTRGQGTELELFGTMPEGAQEAIESSLRSSPDFRVLIENRDAVVFILANGEAGS